MIRAYIRKKEIVIKNSNKKGDEIEIGEIPIHEYSSKDGLGEEFTAC